MNAQSFADRLKRIGYACQKVTEGDDEADGEIQITAAVHVQVPTFGGDPCVVRELAGSKFQHYPPRRRLIGLINDLNEALKVSK